MNYSVYVHKPLPAAVSQLEKWRTDLQEKLNEAVSAGLQIDRIIETNGLIIVLFVEVAGEESLDALADAIVRGEVPGPLAMPEGEDEE